MLDKHEMVGVKKRKKGKANRIQLSLFSIKMKIGRMSQ